MVPLNWLSTGSSYWNIKIDNKPVHIIFTNCAINQVNPKLNESAQGVSDTPLQIS